MKSRSRNELKEKISLWKAIRRENNEHNKGSGNEQCVCDREREGSGYTTSRSFVPVPQGLVTNGESRTKMNPPGSAN